jgi:hypothetical protein
MAPLSTYVIHIIFTLSRDFRWLPMRLFFPRYHHIDHDPDLLGSTDMLPPPIAADLNGDGRVEVITATHDARLQVQNSLIPVSMRASGHQSVYVEL